MGLQESPRTGAYIRLLADEAKRLQLEARDALEQGHYTRASALLGDAELLAEDVHDLVRDLSRREPGGLMAFAAYDIRDITPPAPPRRRMRLTLPSRRMRMAIGASLAIGLALTES